MTNICRSLFSPEYSMKKNPILLKHYPEYKLDGFLKIVYFRNTSQSYRIKGFFPLLGPNGEYSVKLVYI